MTDQERDIDWRKTTFDGSRHEQLRQAQGMTLRQRLEALDQLAELSERIQAMPRQAATEAAYTASNMQEAQPDYGADKTVNEIVLAGCTPTPLADYLKALGVLRLLSARRSDIRGFWRSNQFVLRTSLDRDDIEKFFLDDYQPSALVTPWNGRGGFLEGEDEDGASNESTRAGAQMVRTFSDESVASRFFPLANILNSIGNFDAIGRLNTARAELKRSKAIEKAKGKKNLSDAEKRAISQQEALVKNIKGQLLQELRNNLPDEVLSWFDACLAIVTDSSAKDENGRKPTPSPLLGAGGLDGSMDFGVNYLKRLNDVFNPATGLPRDGAKEWLAAALFGDLTDSLLSASPQDKKKVSVGQFSPSDTGGYNASNGFAGEALLNPWNTILQLEGTVLFAASTVRRLDGKGDIYASLPFTVAPTAIGEAVMLSDEAPKGAKRRTAEMWLPLWAHPAGCRELESIMREGRITLHGSTVTNGFDCARALNSLGASRGISHFQRYTFLKRSGDAFFAVDSGQFEVRESAYGSLVDELDGRSHFLTKLHSFVRSKSPSGEWSAGTKLRTLASRLDNQLVRVLRADDRTALQQTLELLGEIQAVLSRSHETKSAVPPIPHLSERWAQMADDGTPPFRIARALAGLGTKDSPLPLRAQLFPVHPRFSNWMEVANKSKGSSNDSVCRVRIHTGRRGNLPATLHTLLVRRMWLAEQFNMKDKPLHSPAGATLDDIAEFLRRDAMDRRIATLLPGLSLCNIPLDSDHSAGAGVVPAAFAMLKLCFTPESNLREQGFLGMDVFLPTPPGLLPQLASGITGDHAVRAAWRRLHASGLNPVFSPDALPKLGGIDPARAAAALLIPLRYGANGKLARSILKKDDPKGRTEAA